MAKEVNVLLLILEALTDIEKGNKNASEAISGTLKNYQYLDKTERSLFSRVCQGVLEQEIRIDYLLNQVSKTPIRKCKPYIRTLLRMSAYQILYLDHARPELVCNDAVELAKKKGFKNLTGFINGVLRNFIRNKDCLTLPTREADGDITYLSICYSMPEWIVEQFLKWYGFDITEGIFNAFLQQSPLTVRINEQRTTKEQVLEELKTQNILTKSAYYCDNALQILELNYLNRVHAFRDGCITVQDESSILEGYLVCPKGGELILDLCAAPGGKTGQAAERLWLAEHSERRKQTIGNGEPVIGNGELVTGNSEPVIGNGEPVTGNGRVISRDLTKRKVEKIEENIERLQYDNIQTEVWDALDFDEKLKGQADIVIADLPCSGLGVIGRKPDIKYNLEKQNLGELVTLQRNILKNAVRYIKKDGYLVYSTCTLSPEENENQVKWLIEEFHLTPVNLKERLPKRLTDELEEQKAPATDLQHGYATLIPGRQKCDGFFVALLRKVE